MSNVKAHDFRIFDTSKVEDISNLEVYYHTNGSVQNKYISELLNNFKSLRYYYISKIGDNGRSNRSI